MAEQKEILGDKIKKENSKDDINTKDIKDNFFFQKKRKIIILCT